MPRLAEARWLSLRPDVVESALHDLRTRELISGVLFMYWRVESSTDVSACGAPPVTMYTACCETLCARLLWVRIGTERGVARGEQRHWVRGGALYIKMKLVKYGATGLDPNSLAGVQVG